MRIGFEATAREHDRAGSDLDRCAALLGHHARDPSVLAHETGSRGLVADRNPAALRIGIESVEKFRTAAPDVQRKPAPEFEFAVDLIGLPAETRLQLHALARHPLRAIEATANQDFSELRIGAVLRQVEQVIEELFFGVGSEINAVELFLCERWQHRDEIVDAPECETKGTAGEMGIAAALLEGRGFEHQHSRPMLVRRDRGTQGGVAGAYDKDIGRLVQQVG
jgi:hypothetical protein